MSILTRIHEYLSVDHHFSMTVINEMITLFLWLIVCCGLIQGVHFNGGSITWAPLNPYVNSSSVAITITQSYSWSYPTMTCAKNVPISTNGRGSQNDNLTCVVDCLTDGGYSSKPIDILTDCTSSSSSLGIMTSQRSVNVTLSADAYFSVAYQGAAWRELNYPGQDGLDWSIVSSIDLRMREDGFINTAPVASVVSPQYVTVNTTAQIKIPVSDVNTGDDVRCRWSVYQTGYRRRREVDDDDKDDDKTFDQPVVPLLKKFLADSFLANRFLDHVRKKRETKECSECSTSRCENDCRCSCPVCQGTTCNTEKCEASEYCRVTTTKTSRTTTAAPSSTSETPGTKKTTSLYPSRQAVDECGGICYPDSVPSGTTLSNCTLTFTGLVAGAWYAVAVQVIQNYLFETK